MNAILNMMILIIFIFLESAWALRDCLLNPQAPSCLLNCSEIQRKVQFRRILGQGNVATVEEVTIDNSVSGLDLCLLWIGGGGPGVGSEISKVVYRLAVLKRPLSEAGERWTWFPNAIRFASLRVRHPNLMHIYGVCNERKPSTPMVLGELLPRELAFPHRAIFERIDPQHVALPLATRLNILTQLADLIAFMSEKNESRPGSPYLLCDVKLRNFLFASDKTTLKYADFDNIVPLTPTKEYPFESPVTEMVLHHGSSERDIETEPRAYAGVVKPRNKPNCPYPCYFTRVALPFRSYGSEFQCSDGASRPNCPCPGLGVRSTTFWFGHLFLRTLLDPEYNVPAVYNLINVCTHRNEFQRLHPLMLPAAIRNLSKILLKKLVLEVTR